MLKLVLLILSVGLFNCFCGIRDKFGSGLHEKPRTLETKIEFLRINADSSRHSVENLVCLHYKKILKIFTFLFNNESSFGLEIKTL